MNVEEYLHQYYELSTRIELTKIEIADLREKATAIGSFDYAKDRVKSSSPMGARYEKLIEKLADRENQLAEQIEQWEEQKVEVESLLDLIDRSTDEGVNRHKVLYFWYIVHLNANEIADKMSYCSGNIYALRNKGVREIEQHLNKFK